MARLSEGRVFILYFEKYLLIKQALGKHNFLGVLSKKTIKKNPENFYDMYLCAFQIL